jgi:hypothetical protein
LLTLSASASSAVRAAAPAESPAPPTADYRLPDNPADLLRLDDEMRAFFAAHVHPKALLEPSSKRTYARDPRREACTFTTRPPHLDPREAFRRRAAAIA